jgi:hypothetical protein
VTAARLADLKRLVETDPAYAALFAEVKKKADRGVKDGPPKYILDDKWSDTEQLYQREVGEMIPEIALTYCLTGDKQYLDSARQWMLASLEYPTWGLDPFQGKDLAAGHQLYGIAVAYDWLYNDLDDAARTTIRESLAKRAAFMYNAAATKDAYWADSYLQNHLWVNITGLAACGFALYGEVADADKWIALPLEKYKTTFTLLPADGSSFEGVPYWGYGVEYILKFIDLARPLLGEDFYKDCAFLKETPQFRIHCSLPRNLWTRRNNLMSYGDSPRFDWYGPDYLLRRIASEYRDPYAQGFAQAADDAKISAYVSAFLNILWYDPAVASKDVTALPTFKLFDDLGLVFMRSGWTGDENLCSFKCGPHVGKHALSMLSEDPGSGHVHPDEGAFQILAYGDWLIVDDGYAQKWTEYQNTLVVNGVGQEGEGFDWFRGDVLCREKRGATLIDSGTCADMDIVIGDVTAAYKKEAGLKKFIRTIHYLKPSIWVIIDEVEAAAPSTFDFYYHGEYPFEKAGDNAWEMKGEKATLQFMTLAPEGVSATAFKQVLKGIGGEPAKKPLDVLKLSNAHKSAQATFVNVLYACPAADTARASASISVKDGKRSVVVKTPAAEWQIALDPSGPVSEVPAP